VQHCHRTIVAGESHIDIWHDEICMCVDNFVKLLTFMKDSMEVSAKIVQISNTDSPLKGL